jgi:pimeloyl-ACP methyl ester carboxylesterase
VSESLYVDANGLRFHVRAQGSGDRLALCLHGFPELSYSWRHQLPVLAKLGFRAWAPDSRGFGETSRPPRTRDYAIERQIDDAAALIEAAGVRKATVIGHDIGGFTAWHLAMRRPELVERLVVMNMAHPGPLAREQFSFEQIGRFIYVAVFQVPGLAERLLSGDDYRRIDNAFLSSACHPERFTEADLRVYREAAARPGALRAMLAWYRAYLMGGGMLRQRRLGYPVIDAPTLMIWGEEDVAMGKACTIGTRDWVPNATLRYLPHASHWVQQDQPEVVNAMLEAWLRAERVPEAWEIEERGASAAAHLAQRD